MSMKRADHKGHAYREESGNQPEAGVSSLRATDGEFAEEADIMSASEILRRHMEERGLRKTPERFAILERGMRMHGHFSGDELYARLEEEGFHVSRSTVYSTLALLCDCGLVRRHLLSARKAGYEVAERNHCHLVCTRCGGVTEVESDPHPTVGRDLGGFSPSYYSTTVYGLCRNCLAENNKKTK